MTLMEYFGNDTSGLAIVFGGFFIMFLILSTLRKEGESKIPWAAVLGAAFAIIVFLDQIGR